MTDPLLDSDRAERVAEASAGEGLGTEGVAPAGDVDVRQEDGASARRRYRLEDDTGFDEVPRKYRRFYRRWRGPGDSLAPNEVLCPVCKVVIRSARELRPGDRVYCMPCMSRLTVVEGESGRLEARVEY